MQRRPHAGSPGRRFILHRPLHGTHLLAAAEPAFPFSRPAAGEPPKEYAQLRRGGCPVSRARLFDGSPIWLITRHADVCSVLKDGRFSKVRAALLAS